MTRPIQLTSNDTFPTTLTFSTTDPATKVTTLTDLTGFTLEMEIDYGPAPLVPLVKTAVITAVGKCELQWVEGDLKEGEWEARLTITNAANQKLSTEFLSLIIGRDIAPPVAP